MSEFIDLEKDVLAWIRKTTPVAALQQQIDAVTVGPKEADGPTLSTELLLPEDIATFTPAEVGGNPVKGPALKGPKDGDTGNALLFFADGVITVLELSSDGDRFPETGFGWRVAGSSA